MSPCSISLRCRADTASLLSRVCAAVRPAWVPGLLVSLVIGGVALPAQAGEADVIAADSTRDGDGRYRFSVTVRHDDAGWDHYADKWQVLAPDGAVLGERILAHPHDNEQPFTRSLSGVEIPDSVTTVTIRAHDKVHGWGGAELSIDLDN